MTLEFLLRRQRFFNGEAGEARGVRGFSFSLGERGRRKLRSLRRGFSVVLSDSGVWWWDGTEFATTLVAGGGFRFFSVVLLFVGGGGGGGDGGVVMTVADPLVVSHFISSWGYRNVN